MLVQRGFRLRAGASQLRIWLECLCSLPPCVLKSSLSPLNLEFLRQDRDIEPEDFQRYSEKVNTSLQDCPVQRPPAALQLRHRESRAKQVK